MSVSSVDVDASLNKVPEWLSEIKSSTDEASSAPDKYERPLLGHEVDTLISSKLRKS